MGVSLFLRISRENKKRWRHEAEKSGKSYIGGETISCFQA
jgi:hypothetical protein